MLPNLSELQKKVDKLGLKVVQKGKRPAKQDYVDVLRGHFMAQDYPTGLPYEEIEPMLCFAEWNLKPEEVTAMYESPNWIAEWKENGARAVLHWVPGLGLFAQTRNISLKTFRRQEIHSQFLPEVADVFMSTMQDVALVIDVELIIEKPVDTRGYTTNKKGGVVTQTSLHSTTSVLALESAQCRRLQRDQSAPFTFKILDVIKYGDLDGRRAPLRLRREWRQEVLAKLQSAAVGGEWFIQPKERRPGQTTAQFRDEVLAAGGEGIIHKNLNAVYEASSSRQRDAWVKMKKRIEFDAFVSGFERGEAGKGYENLVGNLEFSVHTERGIHMIGRPSNMTMEERQAMTDYDPVTNTVSLKPEYYGKVAEISGQDISARELRLSHCTIDRWRDQPGDIKLAHECKASIKDLQQAAEWVG